MLKREWFKIVNALPAGCKFVRYWDKAGTEGGTGARTAGVLMARYPNGRFCICDVTKGRWEKDSRENVILQTAKLDEIRYGRVVTWVEQEPGSGGKESAENTIRNLVGYVCYAEKVTGDKTFRAESFSSYSQAGNVDLLDGFWIIDYLTEIDAFPNGRLKDQVDGTSGAFNKLLVVVEWVTN